MLNTKLSSLVLLAAAVNAEYWIFGGLKPIVTTRLDPVINPNTVSPDYCIPPAIARSRRLHQLGGHVHSVVGASRFKNVYDPDDLVQSNCTTVPVQPDKSNYWAVSRRPHLISIGNVLTIFQPQLYHQDQQTGQLTPVRE